MQEKLYGNLRFFRLSWTLDRTTHAALREYFYSAAIIAKLFQQKKGTHGNLYDLLCTSNLTTL